jgi:hypothetical protein
LGHERMAAYMCLATMGGREREQPIGAIYSTWRVRNQMLRDHIRFAVWLHGLQAPDSLVHSIGKAAIAVPYSRKDHNALGLALPSCLGLRTPEGSSCPSVCVRENPASRNAGLAAPPHRRIRARRWLTSPRQVWSVLCLGRLGEAMNRMIDHKTRRDRYCLRPWIQNTAEHIRQHRGVWWMSFVRFTPAQTSSRDIASMP